MPVFEFLRSYLRSVFEIHVSQGARVAEMRAAQLNAVLRMSPMVIVANALVGLLVVLLLGGSAPGRALTWGLALATVLAVIHTLWRRWQLQPLQQLSRRGLWRAAFHATVLALVWGLVPILWYPDARPEQRVLISSVIAGMMGGSMLVLMPLPLSALSFILTLTACGVTAHALVGDLTNLMIGAMLVCYAVVLIVGAWAGARAGNALLRSQHEAARQRQFVSVLLHDFETHAVEALWEIDAAGRLQHVSPRLAELLGGPADALLSSPLLELLDGRHPQARRIIARTLQAGLPFQGVRVEIDDAAGRRWWTFSGKPLFGEDGQPAGWRGVIADITGEVAAVDRLQRLAHHDSLTLLANRVTLSERLGQALLDGRKGALLAIDLDHFKGVNDALGHSAGDALLREVAERLAASVRPDDLVARNGGDEFAALLPQANAQQAMQTAERIVRELQLPFHVGGRVLRIGASIGVALLGEHGQTPDELTVHADMALYAAKAEGRGRARLYSADLGEERRRSLELETALRSAPMAGQLYLHWQPQVDAFSGRIVGVEALARWRHPRRGTIHPGEFIPLAERSNTVLELGHWVLEEACRFAAAHLPAPIRCAVNVSPLQLRDPDYVHQVLACLARHQLDPRRLELEITESVFMDGVVMLERLQALRAAGVAIALDDFGTGYSSLAYLRRFRFDRLKIDRAFVAELQQRDDAEPIVRTMVALADSLGMGCIAEGVETPAQRQVLQRCGCAELQGHLIGRPTGAAEFLQLLQALGPGFRLAAATLQGTAPAVLPFRPQAGQP